MGKCPICSKNITKRYPGLECGRCEKIVHASTSCAGISSKQLTALQASNNLEWTCGDCSRNMSKGGSFIVPDEDVENQDDDSENTHNSNAMLLEVKKLIKDVRFEIRKTIKEEMASMQESCEFLSEQYETLKERVNKNDDTIKNLERKNTDLSNKNSNLNLRIAALEQRIQEAEHRTLSNFLEIAGIPKMDKENTEQLVKSVAVKLDMSVTEVESSRRGPGRGDAHGTIIVELRTKATRNRWVSAAKGSEVTVADVLPSTPKEHSNDRIFIREALAPQMKNLLWQTKQQLRDSYKYIWCRDGKVLLKKDDKGKTIIVRSLDDIKALVN